MMNQFKCAIVAVVLAISGVAQADSLGLQLSPPDWTVSFVSANYDGSMLTLSGLATEIDFDGRSVGSPAVTTVPGSFNLVAQIDSYGNASSATLSIAGSRLDNFQPINLQASSLLDFGFNGSLEFLFSGTNDAGNLAPLYGPYIGVIVSFASTTSFSFADPFSLNSGNADVASVIPTPSAALAGLVGVAGVLGLRRRGR